MTSVAGCEVFMVVGFVLAVLTMRQNPAFRSGTPRYVGYRRSLVWGWRLALAGLVPLTVGYFGFFWYNPGLLDGWRSPNNEFVGFFALLGAALVLISGGIVLMCGLHLGQVATGAFGGSRPLATRMRSDLLWVLLGAVGDVCTKG
jgi:hypothetical protein